MGATKHLLYLGSNAMTENMCDDTILRFRLENDLLISSSGLFILVLPFFVWDARFRSYCNTFYHLSTTGSNHSSCNPCFFSLSNSSFLAFCSALSLSAWSIISSVPPCPGSQRYPQFFLVVVLISFLVHPRRNVYDSVHGWGHLHRRKRLKGKFYRGFRGGGPE